MTKCNCISITQINIVIAYSPSLNDNIVYKHTIGRNVKSCAKVTKVRKIKTKYESTP